MPHRLLWWSEFNSFDDILKTISELVFKASDIGYVIPTTQNIPMIKLLGDTIYYHEPSDDSLLEVIHFAQLILRHVQTFPFFGDNGYKRL